MIRAALSRYRPRYIHSLAYMLQVTEYNLSDYLEWYGRTLDFSRIEKRKHLKRTPKAAAVMLIAWGLLLAFYALSLAWLTLAPPPTGIMLALLGVLTAPYLLGYALIAPLWLLRVLVQHPLEAAIVARASRTLAAHPGFKIAVAGSYGKTTMREILRTVLSEGQSVAAPPHSYNTPLGIAKFVKSLSGAEEVLVFELGEYYPGDVRRLAALVRPDLGVITGINEAHLSKFKSLDRTSATIFELADHLGSKPLYVNAENAPAKRAARRGNILYSREGAGDWKISHPTTGLSGTEFTLAKGKEKISVQSQLLGLHQLGPLAAAADIATRLGLTPAQIKAGIAVVAPFEHRLRPSEAGGVITLDDSYNGNPDGVRAVISFLAGLKGHRRFYVTPGLVEMGARTREVHEELGHELAAARIEQVVLIRNSVTPFIAAALRQAKFKGAVTWFDSGPEAFAALPHLTVAGDVVLLQNDWPDQYA
jgi:UDP-N-acetylmuramoyl-tripeptide--D-alanyl-D-alanine ligase